MTYARSSKTSPAAVRAAAIESLALQLRSEGRNYEEIGEKLGIKPGAANAAVRRALARAKKELQENAREILGLELHRLDQLFYHAMMHVRAGDPRAIAQALSVMERRTKYLGLDAAIKADLTVKTEEMKFSQLSSEQLAKIEELVLEAAPTGEEVDLDAIPDYDAPAEID